MSNRDGKYDHWHWKSGKRYILRKNSKRKVYYPWRETTKTSPTSPKRTTQKRQWTRITKTRQPNVKTAHTQVTVALKDVTPAGTSPCSTNVSSTPIGGGVVVVSNDKL